MQMLTAAILLLAVGAVLGQAGQKLPTTGTVLVASDPATDRPLVCRRLPPDGFALAFDHSMYGGEVRERFVPTPDGRLRLLATTTANAAAAEYYAYDRSVVAEGGRFRIDAPPREFPAIVVRVDEVGDHRLLVGAETLDLVAAVGAGRPVRLALATTDDDRLGLACGTSPRRIG